MTHRTIDHVGFRLKTLKINLNSKTRIQEKKTCRGCAHAPVMVMMHVHPTIALFDMHIPMLRT